VADHGNEELIVIGHKNPDTDSICSALAYASYKNRSGIAARAYRAGQLNPQTKFVLDRFGCDLPPLLADVHPRIRDIMIGEDALITLSPHDPTGKAQRIMVDNGFSFLPVVDRDRRCVGKITLRGIASLWQLVARLEAGEPVRIAMYELARRTSGRWRSGAGRSMPKWFEGSLLFLDGAEESRTRKAESLCIVAAEHNLRQAATLARSGDVVVLTVPSGSELDKVSRKGTEARLAPRSGPSGKPVAEAAGGGVLDDGVGDRLDDDSSALPEGVGVLQVQTGPAAVATAICMSVPLEGYVEDAEPTFRPDELVRDAERRINRYNVGGFIVTDDRDVIRGVVTRVNFLKERRRRVALVDHNEFSQAVEGIEQAEIVEILDHHRIAARNTDVPITFINKVVGSTGTIVAELFRNAGLTPEPRIAGVLLSAVLSDTVILRSPTTTPLDQELSEWLAQIAGVELQQWGEAMFAAGSDVHELTGREIVTRDQKTYQENGYRFAFSQIELVGFKSFWDRADDVREALASVRAERGLDFTGLLVTDISKATSLLAYDGDPGIASAIAYPKVAENLFELQGVLSRKKQLLPYILELLRGA